MRDIWISKITGVVHTDDEPPSDPQKWHHYVDARFKVEAEYYLAELKELWNVCMPSRRGNYPRHLGSMVLDRVCFATSWRDRQCELSLQFKKELLLSQTPCVMERKS